MIPALKVLQLTGRSFTVWYLVLETTKKGTYKCIAVNRENDKRKPDKAAQTFIPKPRYGELGWREISPDEIPADVQKRFAEYTERT